MIQEVRDQAGVFANIVGDRSRISQVASELSKRHIKPHRYYAVGCGSSYYAAMISAFYHEHAFGLDSRAFPSSEFVWYPPSLNVQSVTLHSYLGA
jgi:fructoselysine-6-P-deglycase FrlB-like protein